MVAPFFREVEGVERFFVSLLACLETGRSDVGRTDNVPRRYRMHCEGLPRATRSRLKRPVVVYWEAFPTRLEAIRRERYFKNGAGHRLKVDLVAKGLQLFDQQTRPTRAQVLDLGARVHSAVRQNVGRPIFHRGGGSGS